MKKIILLSFFLLLLHYCPAQIHIGPSQTYPNIQNACPFIQPGDTVYVHAGTYASYQYYANLQGTPNAWITIRRFANDVHVIKGGWQFSNLRYVKFENLFFQADATLNSTLMNIDNNGSCTTQSKHIVIDSCQFWDVSSSNSLKFGGVDSAEVTNCIFKNNPGTGAGLALNVCHYIWAHNNYFEDIAGKAIQTKLGTRFVTIERNFIKNCGTIDASLKIGEAGGLNFHCPGDNWLARDIKVHANVIIGGRASFSVGQASDCEFVNNTFVNPINFVTRILADDTAFACSLIVVKNNIFYLTQTVYFNGSTTPITDNIQYNTHLYQNNIFYHTTNPSWLGPDPFAGPYDAEEVAGTQFVNNIIANPLFVNVTTDDVHLTSLSPGISAGMSVSAPPVDYYGVNYFSPRSIGASEYNLGTFVSSFSNGVPSLFIFPNPANKKLTVISEQGTVTIMDALGAIIKQVDVSSSFATLDVSMLANGIYFINLRTSNGNGTQKMIIQQE